MPFFQDVKTCRKQCARQIHTYTPRDGKKREFFFFFFFVQPSLPSRETLEQRERCRNLRIESPFPKRFPLRQFSRGIKSITPALPCKTFPSLCVHIYVCVRARAHVCTYTCHERENYSLSTLDSPAWRWLVILGHPLYRETLYWIGGRSAGG